MEDDTEVVESRSDRGRQESSVYFVICEFASRRFCLAFLGEPLHLISYARHDSIRILRFARKTSLVRRA